MAEDQHLLGSIAGSVKFGYKPPCLLFRQHSVVCPGIRFATIFQFPEPLLGTISFGSPRSGGLNGDIVAVYEYKSQVVRAFYRIIWILNPKKRQNGILFFTVIRSYAVVVAKDLVNRSIKPCELIGNVLICIGIGVEGVTKGNGEVNLMFIEHIHRFGEFHPRECIITAPARLAIAAIMDIGYYAYRSKRLLVCRAAGEQRDASQDDKW